MTKPTLTVGAEFTLSGSLPYTLNETKHAHTYTRRYRVTAVTGGGVDADYVATVAEEDRPPFAGRPRSVSLAAFAVPLYIANGRMTIVGKV